jgi:hypothetical protein
MFSTAELVLEVRVGGEKADLFDPGTGDVVMSI